MKKIGIFGNAVRLTPRIRENTGNIVHANAAFQMFSNAQVVSDSASEENIERLRAECSHLAYAAATVLQVNSAAPWTDKLVELGKFIEKLGLPIISLGFGHSSLEPEFAFRDAKIDERSAYLLRVLADHAETVAVRGELTADLCRKIGVHNVKVVGCQSLYYSASLNSAEDWAHRDRTGRTMAHITYGMENTDITEFCIRNNIDLIGQDEFAEQEIMEGKLPVEVFAGETGEYKLPYGIERGINRKAISLREYHAYISKHFHKFYDMETWSGHIRRNYDFSFGTRFHGNVAALQSGVPALWLTHDTRTVELCRHFRLPTIKARDMWAYRSIDELKEVCDLTPFKNRLPTIISEFLGYMEENGGRPHLTPQFVEGVSKWLKP
jgi:hypothetical protein